jgi:hypothetical protein
MLHYPKAAIGGLRPVNLFHVEQLVSSPKTMKNERERADFARQLAFGDKDRYSF